MGQKVINGDLNVTGAIKHNGTEISYTGITNYEVINRPNSMPTASATSPDLVQYNGDLYKKVATTTTPSAGTVTDLSGTTWELNSSPSTLSSTQFYINFTSTYYDNIINCNRFNMDLEIDEDDLEEETISYSLTNSGLQSVYESGYYTTNSLRTIHIIDGTDVTNATLISWLQSNATQQVSPVTTYSYELVDKGIPTVTIALTQVTQADPFQIQLTNEQYDIFANNKQVLIDLTALGESTVVWNYYSDDQYELAFGFPTLDSTCTYYLIVIDKNTKTAVYYNDYKEITVSQVGSGDNADAGKIIAMDSNGYGTLTNSLPILTTAPSSANTEGGIKIVVLSSEPATKYSGYLYLITGA